MMREIRWHGRGGQGAKSVSQLLAAAMLKAGYQVQAFPEYGPGGSGAPPQAYPRYSTRPIRLHCGVTDPDCVVVLDDSLLTEIDVTAGLKAGGLLLVNSSAGIAGIAATTGYDGPIVCLDALALANEVGGRHGNVVAEIASVPPPASAALRVSSAVVAETSPRRSQVLHIC